MKVLFLTKYPVEGASSRYRVYQYLSYVESAGIDYRIEPFMLPKMYALSHQPGCLFRKMCYLLIAVFKRLSLLGRIGSYDLIYMQRECLPFGPLILESWFRYKQKKMIFDYDDALFIFKPNAHTKLINRVKQPNRIPAIMAKVDCVLAGNDWLKERALEYAPEAKTFYVAEDLDRYTLRPKRADTAKVVIGWLGSPSTEKYLDLIKPVLKTLSNTYPQLRVHIIGGGLFNDKSIRIKHIPWVMDTEVSALHDFDIGIMPLPLETWSQGKSGGKARTYMSVGLPVVCTDIGFNKELVRHSKTGFLVETLSEWEQALSQLIENIALRQEVGLAARAEVERRFALTKLGPEFVEILRDITFGDKQVVK